jgi:exodeoxyribonuclease-1
MKVSPEEYIKMEYDDLKKAVSKSPKVLRSIKNNKSPVLLNKSYGLATTSYSGISDMELKKRAQLLESAPEFLERINNILIEQHEDRGLKDDKENLQPEETLYSGGFASETDSKLMDKFHTVGWDDKVKLLDKFTDERYQFFGKKIIFQEAPEKLPANLVKEVKKNIAEKIFSTEKQNWTTIPEFYKSIDDARNKNENDELILQKLDSYNNFVMEIEKKYETA